jgi:hypothetical protein
MKQYVLYILLFATIFGAGAQIAMESSPPFQILDATKEDTGQNSVLITIELTGSSEITFKRMYYMGHWAALETSHNQPVTVVSARFDGQNKSINMHSDATREVGNQPPLLNKGDRGALPRLDADEAILLYEYNGRPGYFKVSGIGNPARPID